MPSYVIMSALSAIVPGAILTRALDEDDDGEADFTAFGRVAADAQSEIDGVLRERFPVPFSNPIPRAVADSALALAAEKVFAMASVPAKENPFAQRAAEARALLALIAKGEKPITAKLPDAPATKPSKAAKS